MSSETDFLIGGLNSNNYTQQYFVPSLSYYDDELTWCVRREQPLSLRLQIWYVATKVTWILCYSIVSIISILMLVLMRLKRDKYGYMCYEFDCTALGLTYPVSNELPQNRLFPANASIIKIPNSCLSFVCILITVAWNMLLIKMIAWPAPGYQVRTSVELNQYNFHLVGGPFANVSVWKNTKVNLIYFPSFHEI